MTLSAVQFNHANSVVLATIVNQLTREQARHAALAFEQLAKEAKDGELWGFYMEHATILNDFASARERFLRPLLDMYCTDWRTVKSGS